MPRKTKTPVLDEKRRFMRLAGCIKGPPRDLSCRNGFSTGREQSKKTRQRSK